MEKCIVDKATANLQKFGFRKEFEKMILKKNHKIIGLIDKAFFQLIDTIQS